MIESAQLILDSVDEFYSTIASKQTMIEREPGFLIKEVPSLLSEEP